MIHPVSIYDAAKLLWQETHDQETVLEHLRSNGADQLESIKAIRLIESCSLGEAKKIVCHSRVWSDEYSSLQRLHDDIANAIEDNPL